MTPDIQNVKVVLVTPWEMTITWMYSQQSLANVQNIKVGLQFHYRIAGTNDIHVYPVNYYVDATLQKVSIIDEFDDKASYIVEVCVYEGNNKHNTDIPGIDPPVYTPGKTVKCSGSI